MSAHAGEWVITEGGLSPDKNLSVAVYPQKTEHVDEADGTVLLVDAKRNKIIGPLEEVDSTGGTWGSTTTNVRCEWSMDSKLLAVNFRIGRLMHSYQLYQFNGRRAIPFKLPDPKTHPKGKILDVLDYNANPGATISFGKDGSIVERRYGFMPKKGHWDEDYSKYGIRGFEAVGGELLFIYRVSDGGNPTLIDVTTEPEKK